MIYAVLLCRECDHVTRIDRAIYLLKKRSGQSLPCTHCGVDLIKNGVRQAHRGVTDNQKRSRAQEKRAAKRVGGRGQPGSGSTPGAKGDVRKQGKLRIECKFTRANSFSLKLEELMKIEKEAGFGEKPLFEIEFQGVQPHKRYVVLPEWAYDQLTGDH